MSMVQMAKVYILSLLSFLVGVCAVLYPSVSKGQQDQSLSHYMFTQSAYNPGATAFHDAISIQGIMRQQWMGVEGAPVTSFLLGEMPLKFLHGGIGLVIATDKIASYNTTALALNYAYHRNIRGLKVGFGLGLGFFNQKIDFSYFNSSDGDPLLSGGAEESGMILSVDGGLFVEKSKLWYAGVSSRHINQGSMSIQGGKVTQARKYYAVGGYYFKWKRFKKLLFNPSVFVAYTQNIPLEINLGMIAEYNKMFWVGVVYKHDNAVAFMAGAQYKDIKLSYAYDVGTHAYKFGSTHEIRVGYSFKLQIEKPKKSYKNTRYL